MLQRQNKNDEDKGSD